GAREERGAELALGRMEAPAIFMEAEFYQRNFDPREYLKEFYSMSTSREGASAFMMLNLGNLRKIFSLSEHSRGDILIDVGCGPTTYQLLSNHREMKKWLKNEAGAFHWEPKWAKKQEKLRKTVKQVLKCDVTKANPRGPVSLPPADCIVSTLCLEGACKDLATFRSALRNISTLLKPGRHLVMVTALGDTCYSPFSAPEVVPFLSLCIFQAWAG
uniref:Nicotinamide N-methyltransferase n=1 Tax=Corvus moneduloides TaxID=1196302 RepID=A0A8C3EM44_CORMO